MAAIQAPASNAGPNGRAVCRRAVRRSSMVSATGPMSRCGATAKTTTAPGPEKPRARVSTVTSFTSPRPSPPPATTARARWADPSSAAAASANPSVANDPSDRARSAGGATTTTASVPTTGSGSRRHRASIVASRTPMTTAIGTTDHPRTSADSPLAAAVPRTVGHGHRAQRHDGPARTHPRSPAGNGRVHAAQDDLGAAPDGTARRWARRGT